MSLKVKLKLFKIQNKYILYIHIFYIFLIYIYILYHIFLYIFYIYFLYIYINSFFTSDNNLHTVQVSDAR